MSEHPLEVLWLAIAGDGILQLRVPTEPEPVHWAAVYIPGDARDRFLAWCRLLRGGEGMTSLALRDEEHTRPSAVETSNCLWVAGEGGRFSGLLRAFKPRPTLVVREGATTRYAALWALQEPLGATWVERANRRLAAALGGRPASARLDFTMRIPGSLIKYGRRSPVRVGATVFPELYAPKDVVGHLPEGPDPEAWQKRQRERRLRGEA